MDHKLDMLSPRFRPRPGWGGRLKGWYQKAGRTLLERLIIIIAIPLLLIPIFQNGSALLKDRPPPETTPEQQITVTVPAGEGIIHAARTALYEYLAIQEIPLSLAPEQYTFAEDWIARRMEPYVPEPGESLEFSYDLLAAGILKAQSLGPEERAAWLRYVR